MRRDFNYLDSVVEPRMTKIIITALPVVRGNQRFSPAWRAADNAVRNDWDAI